MLAISKIFKFNPLKYHKDMISIEGNNIIKQYGYIQGACLFGPEIPM